MRIPTRYSILMVPIAAALAELTSAVALAFRQVAVVPVSECMQTLTAPGTRVRDTRDFCEINGSAAPDLTAGLFTRHGSSTRFRGLGFNNAEDGCIGQSTVGIES